MLYLCSGCPARVQVSCAVLQGMWKKVTDHLHSIVTLLFALVPARKHATPCINSNAMDAFILTSMQPGMSEPLCVLLVVCKQAWRNGNS